MRALPLIALLLAAPADAGPCKFHHDVGLAAVLLTPEGATIDQFGGVVVAAVSTIGNATTGDPTQQDWEFRDGRHHAIVQRTVIAPGLVVHAPAAALDHDLALVYPPAPDPPMLKLRLRPIATSDVPTAAAPKVKAVTFADRGLGIMLRALAVVELAEAPPADAVALVLYGADHKPRSWVQITDPKRLTLDIYAVDDCVFQIPGTLPTAARDVVTLAWLDATGHLSGQTAPLKVARR